MMVDYAVCIRSVFGGLWLINALYMNKQTNPITNTKITNSVIILLCPEPSARKSRLPILVMERPMASADKHNKNNANNAKKPIVT